MQKIFVTIILCLTSLSISAVDYDKMWKSVESAQKKDMPRSVIKELDGIIRAATREKNYDELLAAKAIRLKTYTSISADSTITGLAQLLADAVRLNLGAGASREKKVAAAMHYAILATWLEPFNVTKSIDKLKAEVGKHLQNEEAYPTTSEQCYDLALACPEMLAKVKTIAYRRAVRSEADDSLYNHDILSVIGHKAHRYAMLKKYYESVGNRQAACVELYLEAKNGQNVSTDDLAITHRRQMLLDGMKRYADLPQSALLASAYYLTMLNDKDISDATRYTYLRDAMRRYEHLTNNKETKRFYEMLSNHLVRLTRPHIAIGISDNLYLKNIRNIKSLTLSFQPLTLDGRTELRANVKSELSKLKAKAKGDATKVTCNYDNPSWQQHNDTVQLPKLPWGVYLVNANGDEAADNTLFFNTDLAVLILPVTKYKSRIVVVSRTTGLPVPYANIEISKRAGGKDQWQTTTLKAGKDGEAIWTTDSYATHIYVWTDNDKAFKRSYFSNYLYNYRHSESHDILTVFTDRGAYQPGQTIQGTVIAHNSYDEEKIECREGKTVHVSLMDTEGETVASDTTKTDAFGHAAFKLNIPRGRKNGVYTISSTASQSINGTANVRIEEYRKPTFQVTCLDSERLKDIIYLSPESRDTLCKDSVVIRFSARTYNNTPVAGAKVVYSITRQRTWSWWSYDGADPLSYSEDNMVSKTLTGSSNRTIASKATSITDSDGIVSITIPLPLPEGDKNLYRFTVGLDVTDGNGESHNAKASVRATRSKDKGVHGQQSAGETKRPTFEVSANAFPRDGQPVVFTMRRPDDGHAHHQAATVFYTIYADTSAIESSSCQLDTVYTRSFRYKKEYGDGLTIAFAWVENGRQYTYRTTINKPAPPLALKPAWVTFRDYTQPGNLETWKLRLTQPDTAPQSPWKVLTATVFDQRIDAISPLRWYFSALLNYYHFSPEWHLYMPFNAGLSLYGQMRTAPAKEILIGRIRNELSPYSSIYNTFEAPRLNNIRIRGKAGAVMAVPEMAMEEKAVATRKAVMTDSANRMADNEEALEAGSTDDAAENVQDTDLSAMVRTDLGETALFAPTLVADSTGTVSISVTMPQTMTTWRFYGFAHDSQMRHCFVDTTCVARKDIIVTPNVPRFLRADDQAVLSTTVTNTTHNATSATVTMQLLSHDCSKVIWQGQQKVNLPADTTVAVSISLPVIDTRDDVLTLRVAAETIGRASDGEQHHIPCINNLERITLTAAFTQRGQSEYTRALADLLMPDADDASLTVKYTDHAEQLILDALPSLQNPVHDDALSVASAVYVNLLNPRISPDSVATSVSCLRDMQLGDGSWPWFRGMKGSPYITATIIRMLSRLTYYGCDTEAISQIISLAMPYLMIELHNEAESIRKASKHYDKRDLFLSGTAIDVLYSCALLQKTSTPPSYTSRQRKDIDYLVSVFALHSGAMTLHTKANAAIILSAFDKKKKADELLTSLMEYSVYTEEAGRYFESSRASYTWRSYRIPTVVSAIEALHHLRPSDHKPFDEMQQWLLHERRTQQWGSSINTSDAIHAFMLNRSADSIMAGGPKARLTIDQQTLSMPDSLTSVTMPYKGQQTFSATHNSHDTAWGALSVTQTVPTASVTDRGTGFRIQRDVIRHKDKATSADAGAMTTGQRVTVRLTIDVDRDYDFVEVTDNRPACLEPVDARSGYCRIQSSGTASHSYLSCYRSIGNDATQYFIDNMPKGRHVIETTYYIDRDGTYHSGTATVRCAYADEYRAVTGSYTF